MLIGEWTVIAYNGRYHGMRYWFCECSCGVYGCPQESALIQGRSQNCGHERRRKLVSRLTKHGAIDTPEYSSWKNMLSRCYNPKYTFYNYYGARGITVCDRWRHSFNNFLSDMGKRPTVKHTLDRKNNDGNYTPDNCRWATRKQQSNNTRVTGFRAV